MNILRWLRRSQPSNTGIATEIVANAVSSMERPYLADMPYVLPKDEREEQRMLFQHTFLKDIFGLYNVPLDQKSNTNVLDVGSGAGHWSREMAHALKLAQVYAIDLEEPKVSGHLEPDNYHYVKANILEKFPFADNVFDLVYQRLLVAAIPTAMWSFLFLEEIRVLKPGGWLEVLEVSDVCAHAGPLMQKMLGWGRIACAKNGIYLSAVTNLDATLKSLGLTNISCKKVDLALGEWGGQNGKKFSLDMINIFSALKDFYRREAGVAAEEFDQVLTMLPYEWNQLQTAYTYYHIYGQKVSRT